MSREVGNLFVVDCSPGLTELERQLLDAFYRMRQIEMVSEIEELYVTTFDASQIQKTIDSLNDDSAILQRGNRNVSIVLNDLHNWEEISVGYKGGSFDWRKNALEILKKLEDKDQMKIRYKKFEKEQVNACMIDNRKKLIGNIYAFVLPQEYREDVFASEQLHDYLTSEIIKVWDIFEKKLMKDYLLIMSRNSILLGRNRLCCLLKIGLGRSKVKKLIWMKLILIRALI